MLDNKSHQPTPSKVRTSAGMFFRRGALFSQLPPEYLDHNANTASQQGRANTAQQQQR